ncbi:MAG: hypothetical protein WKF90_10965 [Pyrinomonadaceae bacterium]
MKTKITERVCQIPRRTLEQISHQVEMALASENVSDDVKECLKTIIFDAANEANLSLNEIFDNDFSRVRATLPKVIEKLGEGYGRGVLDSIHAIIQHNTDAFQKFFDDKLDQDVEHLADLLSSVMKHPQMPTKLYNVLSDELTEGSVDADSPEWILDNLKKWSVQNENAN